jgi:hypothetical protein
MNVPHSAYELGVSVSYGKPLTNGPRLTLGNSVAIMNGLSDRIEIAKYEEVEILGINGALPTYLLKETLLAHPLVFLLYAENGRPVLIDPDKGFEGNANVSGMTGQGKTTWAACPLYQLNRLGFCVVAIGNKHFDSMLYSSLRAAAESKTRPDGNGTARPRFWFINFIQGLYTSGFNYIRQLLRDPDHRIQLHAGNLLQALNLSAPVNDRAGQYFAGSQIASLIETTDWGLALSELAETCSSKKMSRDERYSNAGLTNALVLLAAYEQLNLPEGHPADLNFEDLILQGNALYLEAAGLTLGDTANAIVGLTVQTLIAAKKAVDPTNKLLVFLFIDESQRFPRQLLLRYLEELRHSRIRLIHAYQDASQFGPLEYQAASTTQVRLVFSARPGSEQERFLREDFGTKTIYEISFSHGKQKSNTNGWAEGESRPFGGSSLTAALGSRSSGINGSVTDGITKGYSLIPREVPALSPDKIQDLNDDPSKCAITITPRKGLLPKSLTKGGNLAIIGGPPMTFSDIDRVAEQACLPSPFTFLPASRQLQALRSTRQKKQLPSPPAIQLANDERSRLLAALKAVGANGKTRKP